jgi:predicted DNA-binding protein
MNNLVDLAKERRINGLIGRLNAKMGVNPDFDQRTWAMLNGEIPMARQPLPTSLRLPEPLIERLDRLAERMNADPQRGLERRHKRSDALREAVIRGLSELESDLSRDSRP